MPFNWADLLNPLMLIAFAVWLFMEVAIAVGIVVVVGLPALCLVSGLCEIVREFRGKN